MTLAQELTQFSQGLASKLSPEQQQVFGQHLQRLATLSIEKNSLKKGDTIPQHIQLPNATNNVVSLDNVLTRGPIVLTFYRGDWCPFCNLYLRALQQKLSQFSELGVTLVAISPQTPDHSLTTQQKNELGFDVLSDFGNQVARQFGLVFKVDDAFKELQAFLGVDVANYNADANYELPTPATYIIDRQGKIQVAFIESDWTKRPEPNDILDQAKSLTLKV
jgi:peroxiredoxin